VPNLVDLTDSSNITSIRIHSITDGGGLGFDNFGFATAAVPEPGSALLVVLGLADLVTDRRRLR
jgi:hypothetical protein